MKRIIIFIFLISSSFILWGQNTFEEANQLYKEGKYNEAITKYKELLSDSKVSGTIYYNLGNSYFKSGELAMAILYYERALIVRPGNEDIRENLAFANSQISDKIISKPKYFVAKWTEKIINQATSNRWAAISITLWLVAFVLIFLFLRSRSTIFRKAIFPILLAILIGFVFSTYASYTQYKHLNNEKYGIIFDDSVTIQSTPSSNGTALFILHEGSKVRIIEKVGNWYNIRLTDEREGWLPAKSLEII